MIINLKTLVSASQTLPHPEYAGELREVILPPNNRGSIQAENQKVRSALFIGVRTGKDKLEWHINATGRKS